MSVVTTELIEALADAEHASRARWQAYLHSRCAANADGSLTIPADIVQRWQRQIATPYADLSEAEKNSDRDEVRRIVSVIEQHVALAFMDPEPDPNLSTGGYVCLVCRYDVALGTPSSHDQSCPLWEDVS